jgi:phage tail protein X
MASTMQVAVQQGETLDAVVWRVLGDRTGIVEAAYALNRDLAALGPILPEGHIVTLPVPETETVPERDIIQLWS